jgi:hypothetical protein
MFRILLTVFVLVTMILSAGCATTGNTPAASAAPVADQEPQRSLTPGTHREGDSIVAVSCNKMWDISFARTVGEMRARAEAVRSVCASGAADLVGSYLNDTSVAPDGGLCVEMVVPVSGISCI